VGLPAQAHVINHVGEGQPEPREQGPAEAGSQPVLAQASMNWCQVRTLLSGGLIAGGLLGQAGRRGRGALFSCVSWSWGKQGPPHNLPGVLQPPWPT
jgi:hypothetical protein